MKRRNFLGMLGLAPLGAAVSKLSSKAIQYWAGTTVPRNQPLPEHLWEHVATQCNPADPLGMFYRIEILDFPVGEFKEARVVARGHIMKEAAHLRGLSVCPDGVIRISDLLWQNLSKNLQRDYAARYGTIVLDNPERFYSV